MKLRIAATIAVFTTGSWIVSDNGHWVCVATGMVSAVLFLLIWKGAKARPGDEDVEARDRWEPEGEWPEEKP
jgi:uncharacterized membrane protein